MSSIPPQPSVEAGPQRIEGPLRIEALRRRLAGRPGADDAVRRAIDIERRMQELTGRARSGRTTDGERIRIGIDLLAMRAELDSLVAATLGEAPGRRPGGALAALPADMRRHLADLLGVPLLPDFYPLLELKATEYLEQGRAFDDLAQEFGFLDGIHLGEVEPRGALVLTHNGSLVQLSAPGAAGRPHARRYVYQNIYGGPVPAEGTLVLAAPPRIGERMRSSAMETSAVRKLRLAVSVAPWDREREAFTRISTTLVSMRPHTLWGAVPGWVPSVQTADVEAARADRAGHSARIELSGLLARFADTRLPAADAVVEARILGLCIHLQRVRMDHGERGHRLEDVDGLETDRGARCRIARRKSGMVVTIETPGERTIEVERVEGGDQRVVRGAPFAIVGRDGTLAAVLGKVVRVAAVKS